MSTLYSLEQSESIIKNCNKSTLGNSHFAFCQKINTHSRLHLLYSVYHHMDCHLCNEKLSHYFHTQRWTPACSHFLRFCGLLGNANFFPFFLNKMILLIFMTGTLLHWIYMTFLTFNYNTKKKLGCMSSIASQPSKVNIFL